MEVSGQKCRARVQAEPQRDGQKGVGGGRRGRGTANGSGHGATHVAAALGRLAVHKDDLDHLEALLDHLERQGLAQLDLDCREYAACFSDVDAKVAMDLDRKGRYSMQDIRAALDATKAAAFLYREHCSSLSFHSRVKRRRARVQDHLYLQHAAARPNSSQPAAVLPEDAANTAPFGASEPGTARQDRSALPMVVKVRSRSQHAEEAGARLTATLQAAGFDAASSAAAVKATGGDAESALAVLCQRSYARNDLSVDRGNEPFREQVRAGLADLGHAPADSSTDAIQRALREVVDEELMAMSAILGEDAIAGAEPGSEGVELSWRGEDDGTDVLAGASLVLQLPSGCAYPFRPPAAVLVRHTAASFRDRAALSAAARAEAQRLCCGEPCLHSLMQHLQDNATDIIAAARDAEAAPVQGSGRAGGLDGGNAGEAGTEGGVRQAGSKCGEQDQLGEEQQADEDADDEGEGEGGEEMWRDGEEGDVMEEEEEEEEEEDEEGELAAASRYGPGAAVEEERRREASQQLEMRKRLEDAHAKELAAASRYGPGAAVEEERRREASQQLEMRKRLEDAHAKELAEGAELQSKELLQKLQVWRTSRSGGVPAMRKQRQKLPAWAQAERVVSTVLKEQVSIICGETGCGKTTQVPQFILDHAIEQQRGGYVNMLCTQPRRISATSVAERVAAERGEKLGETVGYSIRLETVRSAKTRLLLCTTGVLLRRLVSDPFLVGVSHVIVDEVHERSLDSDFLLVLLRQLLPQRPDLRLVLMSATVNSQLFRDYFGGAPVLTIPGFTHPVTEHYLENLLEWTKFRPEPAPNSQRRDRPSPEEEQWLKGLAGRGFSSATLATLRTLNQDAVNPSLAFAALKWVLKQGGNEAGAVLVFLPGLMEIEQLHRLCRSDPQVVQATGSGRYLLALHSSLSGPEQSKVFEQPKAGARKVVLATNIAETSITIDDVVWVIDSGRVKEVQYNADSHLQLLVECWTSRASARQRRGRAGRVQPGQCLRLFSSFVHDAVMQQEQAPEMLRVPLEGLCLQIRQLRLQGGLEGFLAAALQPPSPTAISAAITSLKQIGALDEGDELTPLGCHLAGMPLDVRIGKMLLFATMLGCLEPALSCAAVMSCASNPFYSPIDQRDAADEARRTFADGGSDVLTAVRAFREWQQVQKQGFAAERAWCRQNFVSGHNMAIIADLRRHLRQVLRDAGFLGGAWRSLSNRHAADQRLLKAMLVAGLYPNLAKQVGWQKGPPVRPLLKARAHDGQAAQMVDLHPASINAVLDDLPSKLLVYHEKVKSKSLLLRDSTTVTALPLVLFGGPLLVQHHAGQLMVGGEFLTLACSMRAALTLRRLRLQLDLLLQDMLGDRVDLAGRLEERCTLLVDAIVRVLDREKPLQMCTQ